MTVLYPHAANGMTWNYCCQTITTSDLLITEITDPQNSSMQVDMLKFIILGLKI